MPRSSDSRRALLASWGRPHRFESDDFRREIPKPARERCKGEESAEPPDRNDRTRQDCRIPAWLERRPHDNRHRYQREPDTHEPASRCVVRQRQFTTEIERERHQQPHEVMRPGDWTGDQGEVDDQYEFKEIAGAWRGVLTRRSSAAACPPHQPDRSAVEDRERTV